MSKQVGLHDGKPVCWSMVVILRQHLQCSKYSTIEEILFINWEDGTHIIK